MNELLEQIKVMQERNRAFDTMLCDELLRIVQRHNQYMTLALAGSRECERAVSEQLDKLAALQTK